MTAAVLPSFAARYGHRISTGHTAPPGQLASKPVWWSRADWAGVEVWCVIAANRDVCRQVHVDPHTMARVARAMARYADNATGRRCRPTNERLEADLAMSIRQIQRARDGLKRLKLVVETVRGRSIMTRAERLAAWRRGSSHRRIAAEFALLSVRRRPSYPQEPGPVGERVIPPAVRLGLSFNSRDLRFFTRKDRGMKDGAPRHSPKRAGPRTDFRPDRLIGGVKGRLPWLSAVSARRLTSLHRFAAADWTPRDVHTALYEVLRARGWRVPNNLTQPAAYLAALLRDLDPADRPGAAEDAMLAEERQRRAWIWATTIGDRCCVHGHPGGDIPHPVDRHFACPECRNTPTERQSDAT